MQISNLQASQSPKMETNGLFASSERIEDKALLRGALYNSSRFLERFRFFFTFWHGHVQARTTLSARYLLAMYSHRASSVWTIMKGSHVLGWVLCCLPVQRNIDIYNGYYILLLCSSCHNAASLMAIIQREEENDPYTHKDVNYPRLDVVVIVLLQSYSREKTR